MLHELPGNGAADHGVGVRSATCPVAMCFAECSCPRAEYGKMDGENQQQPGVAADKVNDREFLRRLRNTMYSEPIVFAQFARPERRRVKQLEARFLRVEQKEIISPDGTRRGMERDEERSAPITYLLDLIDQITQLERATWDQLEVCRGRVHGAIDTMVERLMAVEPESDDGERAPARPEHGQRQEQWLPIAAAAAEAGVKIGRLRGWCKRKRYPLRKKPVGGVDGVNLDDVLRERDLKARSGSRGQRRGKRTPTKTSKGNQPPTPANKPSHTRDPEA
jgi:hypothetical protein